MGSPFHSSYLREERSNMHTWLYDALPALVLELLLKRREARATDRGRRGVFFPKNSRFAAAAAAAAAAVWILGLRLGCGRRKPRLGSLVQE